MARARFTKIEEGKETMAKEFDNSAPYEGLKPGEVIDVDCEDGQTKEYYVDSMIWDFSHFGDTLCIVIKPCKSNHVIDPVTGMEISSSL